MPTLDSRQKKYYSAKRLWRKAYQMARRDGGDTQDAYTYYRWLGGGQWGKNMLMLRRAYHGYSED